MITHVAIIWKDKTYSLPAPNRHYDIIRLIHEETGDDCIHGEQGFLDDTGRFLRRKPALIYAEKCGQLKPDEPVRNQLYSENLW